MHRKGKKLREEVFHIIKINWPTHVSHVCKKLGLEGNISDISKIRYHFSKLKEEGKIHTKKLDRALVAWPVEIEKLRIMHEFLRE